MSLLAITLFTQSLSGTNIITTRYVTDPCRSISCILIAVACVVDVLNDNKHVDEGNDFKITIYLVIEINYRHLVNLCNISFHTVLQYETFFFGR